MAHEVRRYPNLNWVCPALPVSPKQAADLMLEITANWPAETSGIVGSSLGGYYATWLANRMKCRCVLLNPAVNPARDLQRHIGEHSMWHQPELKFVFQPGFIQELLALDAGALKQPADFLAFIAKGDEVLDWREMSARYPFKHTRVMEGGDHALSDFSSYLTSIFQHFGLN